MKAILYLFHFIFWLKYNYKINFYWIIYLKFPIWSLTPFKFSYEVISNQNNCIKRKKYHFYTRKVYVYHYIKGDFVAVFIWKQVSLYLELLYLTTTCRILFFFFFLFTTAPVTYGSSLARGHCTGNFKETMSGP